METEIHVPTLQFLLMRIELWLSAAFHRSLHHIAHIGTHDGLHHLAGTLELLQKLVHLRK